MRFTKDVVQKLLDLNEGFEKSVTDTLGGGRNYSATNYYLIKGGQLLIRTAGRTSWADSKFVTNTIANPDQTRRFLKKVINSLKTDGIK
ncbi:hypothetical protein [Cohnella panacarvi]|uniref:hypothetical protein n=1 Tax=Cohnella panacarvi TaxID=400776 RepID=UPI00047B6F00|nr:hypothetical protein [Cohnella panacarvi]